MMGCVNNITKKNGMIAKIVVIMKNRLAVT